jgi:predicted aspartyl protease
MPAFAQSQPAAKSSDGVSLYNQKKYREALEVFRAEKQTATVLYYEGLCHANLSDANGAKAIFTQLQQYFPSSPEAHLVQPYLSSTDSSAGAAESASSPPPPRTGGANEPAQKVDMSKLPDKVKVEYKKDRGLMRLKAVVNGSREDFVFDTGAELTVVNRETASKLQFDPKKLVRTMTSTPRGPEPALMTEATVQFGELTRKVPIIIMNLPINLIGANFWEGYNYEIDEWFIRLNKKKAQANVALRTNVNSKFFVPFEQMGNLMKVNIEMNGKQFSAVFDTGCQGSDISLCPQHAMRLGLRSPYINYVERFEFGPIISHHVPARVNQGELTLIGPELLGGRRFTIDKENKTIEFSY